MNCPKCSSKVSNVDTFCPSCGEFLKEQKFERKREDRSSYEEELKAAQEGVERAIIICPRCKQKLSVPKSEKALRITCPRCRIAFSYNLRTKS